MIEDMTTRTIDLTPPLIPNGSHWRLPTSDWVQRQQRAARQHTQHAPWWRGIITTPARLLGLVDDRLQAPNEPFVGTLDVEIWKPSHVASVIEQS